MNLPDLRKMVESFEGRVNHLYLDTTGNVTVGVGHNLTRVEAAMDLPFEPDGCAAHDYLQVAVAPAGHPASFYASLCTTRLSDEAIDHLLESDIMVFLAHLSKRIEEFDSYPEPVQEAVFDMAFNLGIGGLAKFHMLMDALHRRDWLACAEQCERRGVQPERNRRTKDLFLSVCD